MDGLEHSICCIVISNKIRLVSSTQKGKIMNSIVVGESEKKAWAKRTVDDVKRRSLFYNLMDPYWGNIWGKDKGLYPNSVGLVNSDTETANDHVPIDAISIHYDMFEKYRDSQASRLSKAIDKVIYEDIFSKSTQVVITSKDNDHCVSKTFPHNATIADGRDHPLYEAIRKFSLEMYRINSKDHNNESDIFPIVPFVIIHPELVSSLRTWFYNKRLSLDNFNTLFSKFSCKNVEPVDIGYICNLGGVELFQWSHLQVPSGDVWTCYGGVMNYAPVAIKVEHDYVNYISPGKNQIKIGQHGIKQTVSFRWGDVTDNLHRKIQIKAN